MVKFFCRIYKKAINVFCVLALIIGAVYGFVSWSYIGYEFNFGMAFAGGLLGLVITFLSLMFIIPPLMIFFSIDSRLENIEKKLDSRAM